MVSAGGPGNERLGGSSHTCCPELILTTLFDVDESDSHSRYRTEHVHLDDAGDTQRQDRYKASIMFQLAQTTAVVLHETVSSKCACTTSQRTLGRSSTTCRKWVVLPNRTTLLVGHAVRSQYKFTFCACTTRNPTRNPRSRSGNDHNKLKYAA